MIDRLKGDRLWFLLKVGIRKSGRTTDTDGEWFGALVNMIAVWISVTINLVMRWLEISVEN